MNYVIKFLPKDRFTAKILFLGILLITLFFDIHCDQYKGPQWTFLLFYMVLNVLVNEAIGGTFGMIYSILAALSRAYVGTLVWDGMITEMSSSINLVIGFSFISYLIRQKNSLLEKIKRSALIDPLTQLPNRREFSLQLDHVVSWARRHEQPISIAYIDVDNFKQINDKHGHKRGDELLVSIGRIISTTLRSEDIGARLGGDEFAVISTENNNMIHRLKKELDRMCVRNKFDVSFSVGVVNYDGTVEITTDRLIEIADELMYTVKKSTKNGILVHDVSES